MMAEDGLVLLHAGDVVTARRGDAAIGFVHSRVAGDALAVDALFVEASMRRGGVGRALWRAAEGAARAAGAARITVAAEPPAIRFYEAMGCVVTGAAAGGTVAMEMALV